MKVLVAFVFLAVSGVMSQSAVTYSGSVGPVPSYGYAYDVHDPTTGDIKNHQEVRNGDAVSGSYSLIEADGTKRIVEYTADDQHGYNANVRHEAAGAAAAAPVVAKHVAPAYPYAYPAYPYPVKSAHGYPYAAGSGYAYPYAAGSAYPAYPYATAAHAYHYASYPYTPDYYYSFPHHQAASPSTYPYATSYSYAI